MQRVIKEIKAKLKLLMLLGRQVIELSFGEVEAAYQPVSKKLETLHYILIDTGKLYV